MLPKFVMIILLVALAGIMVPELCPGAEQERKVAGIRVGISATPRCVYFHKYEAYAEHGLPWEWRSKSGWGLAPQLDVTAGVLSGGGENGFIGSVGSSLILDYTEFGLELDLGINVNLTDKRHFGGQDFGSILLFGAHTGITYRFYRGIGIQYRLQHLSNGHIFYHNGTPNPGLDEHMIGLSCRF